MRSLPPPRRSRARNFRRLLRYLYRLVTLQFLFRQRSTVVIRRRLWPFHRSSRRYKVQQRGKRVHWYHLHRVRGNIVLDATALGELSRQLEAGQSQGSTAGAIAKKKSKRARARAGAHQVLRLRVVARRLLRWARIGRWHRRGHIRAVVV